MTESANKGISGRRRILPMCEGMTLFAGILLIATLGLMAVGARVIEDIARLDDEARL